MKFFTCKDMAEISCDERKLNFLEKIIFRVHLVLCPSCEYFQKKCELIRDSVKKVMTKKESQVTQDEIEKSTKEALKRIS